MTLRELKKLLDTESEKNLDYEIKIWLPGSTICLTHADTLIRRANVLMIEGNVDPGSALEMI